MPKCGAHSNKEHRERASTYLFRETTGKTVTFGQTIITKDNDLRNKKKKYKKKKYSTLIWYIPNMFNKKESNLVIITQKINFK